MMALFVVKVVITIVLEWGWVGDGRASRLVLCRDGRWTGGLLLTGIEIASRGTRRVILGPDLIVVVEQGGKN